MATWAELEAGTKFTDVECGGCGRRTYLRYVDEILRCDGCGEPMTGCMCPPARPLDLVS